MMHDVIDARWVKPLQNFLPVLLASNPILPKNAPLILHGSTTMGIDDEYADLDIWLLLPDAEIATINQKSPTRFFEFTVPELANRKGHVQAESFEEFRRRIRRCDFHLISELRTARPIANVDDNIDSLLTSARQPMPDDVRYAWFCFHYVEMRGEHRACDNPIDRGDATALLLALSRALTHALQAACILDRAPYRYSKWLAYEARKTPTGRRVAMIVDQVLAQISNGALHQPGPESAHPLTAGMKEIRHVLNEAARTEGIDEPWLKEWWLYIDKSRAGIHDVRW